MVCTEYDPYFVREGERREISPNSNPHVSIGTVQNSSSSSKNESFYLDELILLFSPI